MKWLWLFLTIGACQQQPASTPKKKACSGTQCQERTSMNGEQLPQGEQQPGQAQGVEQNPTEQEPVPSVQTWSLAKMDHELFITDAIVGMQDLIGSRVPVLSVETTEGTSYLQVLRCLSSAKIQDISTGRRLDEVARLPWSQQLDAYLDFDYFTAAEAHPDCIYMSIQHMSDTFADFTAPTGQFIYVTRACLDPSLITRQTGESLRNCSRALAVSSSYDYVNERQDREQEALLDAQQKRLALRGHAIQIDNLVKQMQSALEICQERQKEQIEAVRKKQAIARIVGAGINAVANAFVVTKSLGSVATSGRQKILGATTKLGKAKAVGSMGGNLLGAGMMLGGLFDGPLPQAFVNITAHATDIPRTCYEWEQGQNETRRAIAQYAYAMETWLWSEKTWLDMSRARFIEEGYDTANLPDWERILAEYQRWQATLTPAQDATNKDSGSEAQDQGDMQESENDSGSQQQENR